MSPFYDSVLDLKFDVLEKSAFVLDVAVLVTTFTGTGTVTRIAVVSSVAAADSYITVVAFAAVFVTADTTGAVLAVAGSANCSASLGNRSKKLFIFQFCPLLKKFVEDHHPLALEKGLEAALAFVNNSDVAGTAARNIVVGLIGNCLATPKAKIREAAQQVCNFFIVVA